MAERYNYVVKFLNNGEMTSTTHEYENLFDAIAVAKDTDVNYRPMIPEAQFNDELITLLTSGQITVKHGRDEITVMLTKLDILTNIETPVYDGTIIPFVAGASGTITVPVARNGNKPSPVAKD
jgi:hypothetical protein